MEETVLRNRPNLPPEMSQFFSVKYGSYPGDLWAPIASETISRIVLALYGAVVSRTTPYFGQYEQYEAETAAKSSELRPKAPQ